MSMEGPALAVAGSTARKGRRGVTVNRKEIETNLKLRVISRTSAVSDVCINSGTLPIDLDPCLLQNAPQSKLA